MRLLILAIPLGLIIFGAPSHAQSGDPGIENGPTHPGARLGGNVGTHSCIACHDDKTLMLRSESDNLCYPCHSEIQAKSSKPNRHIEVVEQRYPGFGCEGCHKIHRAGGNHFLRKDELNLCRACHEETKQGKSHPVINYTDSFGRQTRVIGPDGREVNCASHCHDVHGAEYGFLCRLEPGRELCISCHTEFE